MTVGAFALVLAALAGGETLAVPEEADTWLAIASLVVLGSVGVFALNLVVLGRRKRRGTRICSFASRS